jgi:HSP20 family molecular chaperone IbpA
MRNCDLTPLWRSSIGFDRLFDLIDESARWMGEENYPPYNIERTGEDHYQISLALAGFTPDEVTITAEQNVLTIEGRQGRVSVSLPGHFSASVPAGVQPRRLRRGQGRFMRGRTSED